MDFSSLIPLAMTIVKNGTFPIINIPATLTPILGPPAASAITNPLIDTASISGLLAMGTAIYAGVKDHLGNKQSDVRASAIVGTQERTINSLKSSDLGAESDAIGINALVMKLCENPDLSKLLNTPTDTNHGLNGKSVVEYIKDQSDGWEQSNKEYYSNSHPTDGDTAKDPVVRKLAEITKLTSPTIT